MYEHKVTLRVLLPVLLCIGLFGCSETIFEQQSEKFRIRGKIYTGPITTKDAVAVYCERTGPYGQCNGRILYAEYHDSLSGYFVDDELFLLEHMFDWHHKQPESFVLFNLAKTDCTTLEITAGYHVLDSLHTGDCVSIGVLNTSPSRDQNMGEDFVQIDVCRPPFSRYTFLIRFVAANRRRFIPPVGLLIPYARDVSCNVGSDRQIYINIVWNDGSVTDHLVLTLEETETEELKVCVSH